MMERKRTSGFQRWRDLRLTKPLAATHLVPLLLGGKEEVAVVVEPLA